MIGRTLSHFKITAKLGEGGMGEVYRATDTKLGREVAIKVLPDAFAEDPERFARFEREARVLATLNHPNIAAIYDLAEDGGTHFLVLELAEGEDLAARLSRGPIPVEGALPLALQIAEALEVAHEKGIVHRDLKPANVIVGQDGAIKVLDFGLAKVWAEEPHDSADLSCSPTRTAQMTTAGSILGTAAYMSPEQARGNEVDRRSDIWSFGTVLWEMLCGRPLFGGETASDLLAAVLREEPDFEVLPAATHPALHRLLRRCLERDLSRRLQHAGDARLELCEAREHPLESLPAAGPSLGSMGVEGTWTLTTQVCSHLQRETLDPALIGDHLEYLDNQRSSDVLVMYLAGFGLGHSTFETVLESSPYRGVAVTLYGLQQRSGRRIPLPIADHLTILRLFLQHLNETIKPAITIVTGFSSGADVALRLISEGGVDHNSVAGVLALSPNLNLDTCFVSAQVASIPDNAEGGVFRVARDVMAGQETADVWLLMNPYLVELVRRFRTDVGALRRHAQDIVAPFKEGAGWPLSRWYQDARRAGVVLRVVFASTESEQVPLRGLMLAHVDDEIFGPDFDDSEIVTEPDSHHFDLMRPSIIEKNLVELVSSIRAAGTTRPTN
jgi:serine/threonine protein kinase